MLPGRNLRSYLVRLRNASVPEMAYRGRQALEVWRLRRYVQTGKIPVRIPPIEALAVDDLQMPTFEMAAQDSIIENILGGMVFTLSAERERLARF
jgi:hypothetical protein